MLKKSFLFLLVLTTGVLTAQTTYYVSTTGDDTNDGTSWATSFRTLQQALQAASTPMAGDRIWVAAGTYYPDEGGGQTNNDRNASFALKNNLAIYGGFAGNEATGFDLNQRDLIANATTLSGRIDTGSPSASSYHVVTTSNLDATAILDGFAIVEGVANGSTSTRSGGGLYNAGSNAVFRNCRITGNIARNAGGGVFNVNSSPSFINCVIAGNHVTTAINSGGGGGMFNNNSDPLLINCTIAGNRLNFSFANVGSGLHNSVSSSPTLSNCIVWGNSQSTGTGEVTNLYNDVSSSFTANHSVIEQVAVADIPVGGNNLDGTDVGNTPLFVNATQPNEAPTTGGDFRLLVCSPLLDAGDNAANPASVDAAGNARVFSGTIDLGAYELQELFQPNGTGVVYVKTGATGTADGSSWANAFPTLQDALASPCRPFDEIWVATGSYFPDEGAGQTDNDRSASFALQGNLKVLGGFTGTEPAGFDVNQRDFENNPTILSGDIDPTNPAATADKNSFAILVNLSTSIDATAILDGFVLEGAVCNSCGANSGAMVNSGSSPTIRNCIFRNNAIGNSDGGGVLNAFGSPTFTNCVFVNNSARQGGAMKNSAATVLLTNCTFEGNTATEEGGGIDNFNGSNVTLTNCIFWNNRDQTGIGTANANYIVNSNSGPGSTTISNFSLLQGFDGVYDGTEFFQPDGGTNNLDGTDPNNNPQFLQATDFSNPSTVADLRLSASSPVLNVGNNTANSLAVDVVGNARLFGTTIDLGAYELQTAQVLPVEYGYFRGETAAKANVLYWSTLIEQNAARFEVEHSTDGRAFQTIGIVRAVGSTETEQGYDFHHAGAPIGTSYYRLRQFDMDGTAHLSDLMALYRGVDTDALRLTAFPNPATDYLTLAGLPSTKSVRVTTFDVRGRRVLSQQQHSGGSALTLDVRMLPAGVYLTRILLGTESARTVQWAKE